MKEWGGTGGGVIEGETGGGGVGGAKNSRWNDPGALPSPVSSKGGPKIQQENMLIVADHKETVSQDFSIAHFLVELWLKNAPVLVRRFVFSFYCPFNKKDRVNIK